MQNFAASLGDGLFNAVARLRLNQENHAATASSPANLARKCAIAARVFYDAVDGLCGNRGEVAFAKRPFLAHELTGFLPIGFLEGHPHVLGNLRNPLKTLLDRLFAAD